MEGETACCTATTAGSLMKTEDKRPPSDLPGRSLLFCGDLFCSYAYTPSCFFTSSSALAGFVFPDEAFMTCPTNHLRTGSFPPRT